LEMEEAKNKEKQGNGDDADSLSNQRRAGGGRVADGGSLAGTVTNVLVIGGFAAFLFIVQYVLQSIASGGD